MRAAAFIVSVAAWFFCVGFFIYWFLPRETRVAVVREVHEIQTRTYTATVRIGDQDATFTIPIPHEVTKPVYDFRTQEPSREELLRFVIIAVMGGLVLLCATFVVLAFGRCLWLKEAPTKSLDVQLASTMALLIGTVGGFLAAPEAAQPQQIIGPPPSSYGASPIDESGESKTPRFAPAFAPNPADPPVTNDR